MRPVSTDLGHTVSTTGDITTIRYRHKKPSIWWGAFYVVCLTAGIGLPAFLMMERTVGEAFNLTNGAMVQLAFALSLTFSCLIVYLSRSRRPSVSVIRVTPQLLDAKGMQLERQHIRAIYAKEPYHERIEGAVIQNGRSNMPFIALGASGSMGVTGIAAAGLIGAHQVAEDLGRGLGYGVTSGVNAWFRSRGWSICMNYGPGKRVCIAHGLHEAHVEPLLHDLASALRT